MEPEDPRDFVMSIGVSPSTLDPAVSQDSITNDLLSLVFEGLVAHGRDSRIEPRLAESWTISPDGRIFTFHLRKNTKFHNGAVLEAADVKWTWERNCDPKLRSVTGGLYLGDILGAKERLEGRSTQIKGLRVIDPHTLEVTLEGRRPFFLGKLTYPVACVMPRDSLPPGHTIAGADEMVGAGPFTATAFTPEAQMELEGFADYARGPVRVRKLTARIVKDAATRVGLLKRGGLDWAGIPINDVEAFRTDPAFALIEADRPAVYYLGMNGSVYPPFADVRVRQAFNHAIDRERIVASVMKGIGKAADGILPTAVPQLRRRKPVLVFDPGRARSLVREAGWEGRMPRLDLWVSDPTGDRKRAAEMAVSMLRENLGIDVSLKLVEGGVLIQRATKRELGFFMGSWFMDYLDAENLLSVLLSGYGQNRTSWDAPEFTELCRRGDSMPDGPARQEVYAKAEDIALREAPWVPLYFYSEAVAVRRGIEGLEYNAFGLMPPVRAHRRNETSTSRR